LAGATGNWQITLQREALRFYFFLVAAFSFELSVIFHCRTSSNPKLTEIRFGREAFLLKGIEYLTCSRIDYQFFHFATAILQSLPLFGNFYLIIQPHLFVVSKRENPKW